MSRPVFNNISHEQQTQIVNLNNNLDRSTIHCKTYDVFHVTAFTFVAHVSHPQKAYVKMNCLKEAYKL
jgi:hypothetical protein